MAAELMNMTLCPNCNRVLNYSVRDIVKTAEGQTQVKCPQCGHYVNVVHKEISR